MEWKKRNESLLTVEQIVENNVKIPINEFLNPPSNPYLTNLNKAVSFAKEAMKTMDVNWKFECKLLQREVLRSN